MKRLLFCIVGIAVIATAAHAGLPRGAILTADEQDADTATGITIARGNAEIAIERQRILGRADQIEINPAGNEIRFNGRAVLTVGGERYESDVVTCTLDFNKCAAVARGQALPAPAVAEPGAAVINP